MDEGAGQGIDRHEPVNESRPPGQVSIIRVHHRYLNGRVKFQVRDAGEASLAGPYDLVTVFECLHDMSDPVGVLRTISGLVNGTGAVIIADERVGDTFTPTGNEVEWTMYGWSVLHCNSTTLAPYPSKGTTEPVVFSRPSNQLKLKIHGTDTTDRSPFR